MTADTAIILHPTLATNDNDGDSSSSKETHSQMNRYRGLSNQGATCYLNSLLQSLYMTPEFRSALFSWTYDEVKDGPQAECIPFQLQSLFGQMQLSKQGALTTESLTKSFGWGNAEAFQQQDVQELCRVLFDRLEEAFKDTPNENLVNDLYQGLMVDYLETIGYDYESKKPTEFLDISLQVKAFGSDKAFSSVEESLRSFLTPEKLEGDNQYFCEKANSHMDAIKGFRLEKLPYILTLQLKRFDLDYTTFSRIKLNDQVRFPRVLNMNPYLGSDKHSESEDVVEDTDFEKSMTQERERLKTSQVEKADNDIPEEFELPDLVDASGQKAPSQIAEEEAARKAKSEAKYPEDADPDPAELVRTEGEWVYELYAVLIHSGSALGGHYYAYIKNMSEQKWFNFNDSTVTELVDSFGTVRNAWGGKTSSHSTSYGANAYMLMYRKFDPSRNQREPADESIPQYIRDSVHRSEEDAQKKREMQIRRARQLDIKVVLGGPCLGEKEITVSHDKDFSLKTLKIAAATAFGIKVKGVEEEKEEVDSDMPDFDDSTYGDLTAEYVKSINEKYPEGVEESDLRLRDYNFTYKLLVKPYESEDMSLAELKFTSYKKVGLEVRCDKFEEVLPDSAFVRLIWYDPTLDSKGVGDGISPPPKGAFRESIAFFYSPSWTVGEFRTKVAAAMGVEPAKCRLLRVSTYSTVSTIFYDKDDAIIKGCYWYEGSQIWAEECELDENGSFPKTCLSQSCYDDETAKAPVTVTLLDEDDPSLMLDIDLRWTVAALRKFLSNKLNVEERGFRIKMAGGKECKDDSRVLRSDGFYKMMKLYLTSGTPPSAGDFYVKCFLLNTQGCKPGIKRMTADMQLASSHISTENESVDEAFENINIQEPAQAGDVDPFAMEVMVREDTPIYEVRKSIKSQLVARGLFSEDGDPNCIRLREKQAYRGGRVARNGATFKESFVSLFDGKDFAATILDEPEDLSHSETGSSFLVWVVRWHRDTWKLGERFEVLLQSDEPLVEANARIAKLAGIQDPANARVLRVIPYTTLKIAELETKPMAVGLGQAAWQNFAAQSPDLTVKSAQLNLLELSSDLLVIQDSSEVVRVLTDEEKGIVDKNTTRSFVPVHTPIGSLTQSTYKAATYKKPKETGIRIKTRQDRALEREAEEADASETTNPLSAQSDADLWDDDEPPPLMDAEEEDDFSCLNELD